MFPGVADTRSVVNPALRLSVVEEIREVEARARLKPAWVPERVGLGVSDSLKVHT